MDPATANSLFFSTLNSSENLMDVTFTFPCHSQTTFKAHKFVLATWSPVFRAMFYGGFKESSESVIELKDISPEPFQKMLRFLYCQPIDITDIAEAIALHGIADKYDLPLLVEMIEKYFCSKLTADNCCDIYEKVSAFKMAEAMKKCEEIFINQSKAVIDSAGFLQSSSDTINKIGSLEKFVDVSEYSFYKAIEKWILQYKLPKTVTLMNT